MTWFKVDDKFHSHPKAMATSLAALGLWTVAGSWSSDHHSDGVLPDYVVRSLSRGESSLADELVTAGLWRRTKGGYRFHQWDADGDGSPRNPTREEAMTMRANKASGGVIGNHRRWHVQRGVSDPKCRFCQQKPASDNRSETDRTTDTPTESGPNPPSPRPSKREEHQTPTSSGARSRGTRIPDDFAATEAMITWARENTPLVGKTETENFRDYWTAAAGANASKRDWVAAWRKWMRNAQADAERRTPARTTTTNGYTSQTDANIAAFLNGGNTTPPALPGGTT
jgi:hypothetical protein